VVKENLVREEGGWGVFWVLVGWVGLCGGWEGVVFATVSKRVRTQRNTSKSENHSERGHGARSIRGRVTACRGVAVMLVIVRNMTNPYYCTVGVRRKGE